jgi:hypothetical protein
MGICPLNSEYGSDYVDIILIKEIVCFYENDRRKQSIGVQV